MRKDCIVLVAILVLSLAGCSSSAAASPAARIVSGVVTKVVSTIFKRVWALKPPTKNAVPTRSMMKFEGGYTVETVFDGSKLGIEPHSVEVSTAGEIFILDSGNSNIYKTSSPLTRHSRPKLLAGSAEGHTGHVDGKLRQARMNHPKGLAVDDSGNIYIADTLNMAIRKISDNGVVTIAGGKSGRGGGHVDGPSEEARFSDDFDVVYIGSSCSLLVIDRGHRAIREIQLHDDDCDHQDDDNLHLGIAVLTAVCFLGYMLALLQRRISAMLSYDREQKSYAKGMRPPSTHQRPPPKLVYPPLLSPENEHERHDEGLFTSFGRLFSTAGSSIVDILVGLFSSASTVHNRRRSGPWPVHERFVVSREGGPSPVDTWNPSHRQEYPVTAKYNRAEHGGNYGPNPQRCVAPPQHHQHHRKHRPASPRAMCYEPRNAETGEIVWGAVQEEMVEPIYCDMDKNNKGSYVRSRYNNYYVNEWSYGY